VGSTDENWVVSDGGVQMVGSMNHYLGMLNAFAFPSGKCKPFQPLFTSAFQLICLMFDDLPELKQHLYWQ
jgi:hypothetical protein